jgi:hypothetical protein
MLRITFNLLSKTRLYFDNQIDPFIPEWWANEVLYTLSENLVAAAMVNRDFENQFQQFGDVINVPTVPDFEAYRKSKNDEITIQDLNSGNIQVKLDQHIHVAFSIKDVERSMSMMQLQNVYAKPATLALARALDRIVIGQYPRFLANTAGKLNGITKDNIKDYIIDLRQVMDDNKVPEVNRNLLLTTKTEGDCLRPEWFTSADKVGDQGTALRTASLGQKLGFDFFKSLNAPNIANFTSYRVFAVNNAAGYPIGTVTLTVDTGTGIITTGTWLDIGGIPYQVSAHSETSGATTSITLASGLRRAVADNDSIYALTPGAVNNAAGYAAGYDKEITVDGFTVAPRLGQFVTFGSTVTPYTIIRVNGLIGITLDRGLDATVADNTTVNIGPNGAYNLAFNRNAMTLAVRPLAPVMDGTGALSAVLNYQGIPIRIVIGYDMYKQQHVWNFDLLAGISVLDQSLGAVLLG